MEYNEICNRVVRIVAAVTGAPQIELDTPLIGEGKLIDSMTVKILVTSIEEEFQIGLEDDLFMDYLDSVQLLIDEVYRQVKEK